MELIVFVKSRLFFTFGLFAVSAGAASAGDGQHFWSGDWYLSVGAAGFTAPKFEGSKHNKLQWAPLISVGKQGPGPRFSSRNDNPSFAFIDNDGIRAGIVGKFVPSRDSSDGHELKGLKKVKWGAEVGGFVEAYPTDWLRARVEVRQGIRAHSGVVADAAIDAFTDITPELRLSGGPRMTLASPDYFDTYYGVNAKQSAASGLSRYNPGGGVKSVGAGGALTWKASQNWTTSAFVEYSRLTGPAADSSLVRERGDRNQLLVGVSASYKFNFTLN
ncbi:MipA/OmpV family protein [Rhizobium sp. CB3060]|uniref:MipA/OmpV family protein n=1 Tax=Rhizobium sp. CB3060 TaxID=3138255 RepID=UPI0021A6E740|nr:MipA/OmpV family protein [Rhizobium tropici]UWU21819.1 MipA/OmpV family protein [Rhizobium tropici]